MSLFESYEDEIKSSFKKFEQIITGFQHLSLEQKSDELRKLDELLSDIESGLQSLNLESNRTGKPTQHYFTQFYNAKKTYQQYKDKYQHDKNYNALIPSSYGNINADASQTQRDRVNRANKNLESGIQMIKMATSQVREDQKTAESTLETLAVHRERLLGFDKKMDNIDGFLHKTRRTIGEMSRRAVANKVIMIAIILVLLISIILIVWLKFVHTGDNNNNNNNNSSHQTTDPPATQAPTPTPTPTDPPSTSAQ